MEQGTEAFERGDFEAAVSRLGQAAKLYREAGDAGARLEALQRLADAQQALGEYREAARSLHAALQIAESGSDPARVASVLGALGNVHIALGPASKAEEYLTRAVALAEEAEAPALAAAILNNLGNHHAYREETEQALAAYLESASLASKAGNAPLGARSLANAAHLLVTQTPRDDAALARSEELAGRSHQLAASLPASHEKAYLLINLARTYDRLSAHRADAAKLRLRSQQILGEAIEVADAIADPRALSYALGYMGALYEEAGRYEEALQLTRRATFQAQQIEAPESLYLWQWQTGRLLDRLDQRDGAISAYQRAVRTLQQLRYQTTVGYGTACTPFRESVGPVYFELVDLLLQQAAESGDPGEAERLLFAARDTVEILKAAELRDYFRDECVDALQEKLTGVELASPSAVVVYPIMLPERTVLMLFLPTGRMKQYPVAVSGAELATEIGEFRRLLEKRTTREYLPRAQKLYEWLIRPFEADLAGLGVDTLVFVPGGPLRTIPMSALHDGEHFLIEKYAVAITPGLELTDPRPIDREKLKLLLGGLSESVAGYPALPHVSSELESIQSLFGGDLLLNQDFRRAEMQKSLSEHPYTVLHMATHANFAGDVDETFLLAYDGRLTMNQLGEYIGLFKFRETPLELLALSACETAQGDERAALGLSGIAVKAGARSALGTLWQVSDVAASELVIEFYRQLHDETVSRGVALQRAQLKLLGDLRHRHPGYWSSFLLISNWL
jgi:CHAT domain-containing protein